MGEPFATGLRVLHVGGGWIGFVAAVVALLATKGGRPHIMAGRCFTLGLGTGATAGVLLAGIRSDPEYGLFFLGLTALFATGTGYLAPRIGRGSRESYRWDRVLTALGVLATTGLLLHGLTRTPFGVAFQADRAEARPKPGSNPGNTRNHWRASRAGCSLTRACS